jgi:hypothetical protein
LEVVVIRFRLFTVALCLHLFALNAFAQSDVPFVGMGDSIGEGVQSADASYASQPYSFLNLIAWRMGAPFPLPYIVTGWFGSIASVDQRSRFDPSVAGYNLAVNGADVGSLLRDRADAASPGEINSETDLVLYPRRGSQMEVAEGLRPGVVACWIGSNDALSAVLATDHLDASQLTPIPQFTADFTEIVTRLSAMGTKAVFGTIPDVTRIAYLVDNDDLVRFLGTDHGLPEGSWTTLPTLFALRLGALQPSILSDPNYILDASEVAIISARIHAFNDIIRSVATSHGMAVAETSAFFDAIAASPPVIAGVPITTRFLGGLFSLDGVHPSNFGQALAAMMFIDALNARYSLAIPQLDGGTLVALFLTDPFIDKDGDGKVAGRFGFGLLETLSLIMGISGDTSDALPASN